jgi:peptide-methionine (S)-S-oxide reductase
LIFGRTPTQLPTPDQALPGRNSRPFDVGDQHLVLGTPLEGDVPEGHEVVVVGLGCFWGEEKTFWQLPGVWSTSVGYAGGTTPNPTYEEVCSGRTGHAEVVRVVYDPSVLSFEQLLKTFWENHDPTQGMRQGNDRGTQYRSVIYTTTDAQLGRPRNRASATRRASPHVATGRSPRRSRRSKDYWYAEEYHQQYLVKNPFGYCPLHATGVTYEG